MANHEEICRSWAHAWGNATPEEFTAQYADDAVYVDHAFRIARSGRDAIEEHCAIWRGAITNFQMTPREIHATGDGALMTFVGTGHFTRDLSIMVATGESFIMHGAVRLTIDAAGKITVTEEYYSTTFAQVGGQESYPRTSAGQRLLR